jgi:hypothetical protein
VASLTERYIDAVVRSLPHARRDEVAADLRRIIAGEVAVRGGDDAAERDVLLEMGDPRRVAREVDHRRHRIVGVDQYPAYIRVLRDATLIVVPVVALLGGMTESLVEGSTTGSVLWAALVAGIAAAVVLAVVVTVGYAVAGRVLPARVWSLDELPDDPAEHRVAFADLVLTGVVVVLTIGIVVWQEVWPPISTPSGAMVPVLSPELWDLWIWVVFALLVASFLLLLVVYRRGRWTMPLAVANAAIDVALVVIAGALAAADRIANPEAVDAVATRLGREELPAAPTLLVVVLVGVAVVGDAVGPLRAARR